MGRIVRWKDVHPDKEMTKYLAQYLPTTTETHGMIWSNDKEWSHNSSV